MTNTRELKFSDFDEKSKKEMLERKARLHGITKRKIEERWELIDTLSEDSYYWIGLCKTEEEKEEIRENTRERILEIFREIEKYRNMKEEIISTEPHKLKAIYILSSF